jgi:hypothetical protein
MALSTVLSVFLDELEFTEASDDRLESEFGVGLLLLLLLLVILLLFMFAVACDVEETLLELAEIVDMSEVFRDRGSGLGYSGMDISDVFRELVPVPGLSDVFLELLMEIPLLSEIFLAFSAKIWLLDISGALLEFGIRLSVLFTSDDFLDVDTL